MSESNIPVGLVKHFQEHNRRALLLAFGCLFGSAVCWVAVYGLLTWAELLFLTTTRGINAPSVIRIGPHFLILAGLLFAIGSVVRRWKTQNEKFHFGLALLTILSIPARLTYAIWDNFFARVHPSAKEIASAWIVLEALRLEKKISITHLPSLLPPHVNAQKLVYLLAIGELIDTDNYGGIYYHHLRNQKAEQKVRRWQTSLELED